MKTLVTGATGLIGSRLVARLVSDGGSVRIFRRESSRLDLIEAVSPLIQHAIGDITDRDSLDRAFEGITDVYHVAANISEDGRTESFLLQSTNVLGTANVVDAAIHAGVRRLVHTSSFAAFGRGFEHDGIIDETADWEASSQNSKYALSKHLAELEVFRAIGEGMDAVIVNPSLVFGVGRKSENTRRIVEAIGSRSLPAIPAGSTNVVDVDDVVDGHVRAMNNGASGERYFLGAENLTWKEIIETIAAALSVAPPSRVVSPRVAHAIAIVSEVFGWIPGIRPLITRERASYTSNSYRYDNRKARVELGVSFRSFSETMARIATTLSLELSAEPKE